MRYRLKDGEVVDAFGATEPWLWFTIVLGFVIGGVLTWLAWRGKQRWLLVWSVGLIVCSAIYAAYEILLVFQ